MNIGKEIYKFSEVYIVKEWGIVYGVVKIYK
jgi:hypothetical protein